MFFAAIAAHAQLNGTFTVGGPTATYTTIEAAIAALSAGVNGPVTFRINGGTYTPPEAGYQLTTVSGMNATNTVTFKPARNETVVIQGSSTTPIFNFDGGDYFIFDGTNKANTKTRDWQVINTSSGPVVQFINGATHNTLKNMSLIGASGSATMGIIKFSTSTAASVVGNSDNVITGNTIGDSTGAVRSRVGIYARGTAARPNSADLIDDNDIINFGRGNGIATGISIAGNTRDLRIMRNRIHMTDITGTDNLDVIYGVNFAGNAGTADSIAENKIWDLNTVQPTAELDAVYIPSLDNAPMAIVNNMITVIADNGTLNGVYIDAAAGSTVNVEHNTIHIGGTNTDIATTSNNLFMTQVTATVRNNVFSNTRRSRGDGTNLLINRTTANGLTSNYNLFYTNRASTALGSFASVSYADLGAWRGGSGGDQNSVSGPVTFAGVANGNLHINKTQLFPGESAGIALNVTHDFDGDTRDPLPDMGADEGDFNGGGLAVVSPNGGEFYLIDYSVPVQFSASRPMQVSIQLSTDNGATWADEGNFNAVAGQNSFPIMMPGTETSQGLVRVVSARNQFEADTSNAPFDVVRPDFAVLSPNGGESVVAGDTVHVSWSASRIPADVKFKLDYSTDNGGTWAPIATDLSSQNLPQTNVADWVVPDVVTNSALVRLGLVAGMQTDVSDNVFTILPQPQVTVTKPVAGDKVFVGDTSIVRWTSITTDYVRLQYSTDGGATWTPIVPNDLSIPAYLEQYPWVVPNTVSNNVLVRVIDGERPRYADTTDALLSIVRSAVQVTSPNGGERFEMNAPVTVSWNVQNATTLRLEYSADGGTTWGLIAGGIAASDGMYTFTPNPIPTKRALVRLTDADHSRIVDQSDVPFEIMTAKSISVYSPATGDHFVKGSTTVIAWDAPRVDRVDILYSSDQGGTWSTIVSNIPSIDGAYVWTVPGATTTGGKIRVREAGGSLYGETGIFTIEEPAGPSVSVITPNGGESYLEGSTIPIRWTANALTQVTIAYSSDEGGTWTDIATNIPATQGQLLWTAPSVPGHDYMVRIVSTNPAVSSASANPFSITRRLTPTITVVAPNGGEKLGVGSSAELQWTAKDISGQMIAQYSVDGGATWTDATTMPSTGDGAYSFTWTVPNSPTAQALVRVMNPAAGDSSDAMFEIVAEPIKPVMVLSPNGGEVYHVNEQKMITWDAPLGITAVDIDYSLDDGANWLQVASSVPSTVANMQYAWMVPAVTAKTTTARVRVKSHADATLSDISDAGFTIEAASAGVDDQAVAGSGTRVLGNFPNPFSGATEIRWAQGSRANIAIRLYDRSGGLVRSVGLGNREAGTQQYTMSGGDLASGMYVYELTIGSTVARGVMMVVR